MDPIIENQGQNLSLPRVMFALGVNLTVLAELCVAIYAAAAEPEDFTMVFMKVFFGMLVPTLLAVFFLKRRRLPAAGRKTA